MASIADFTTDMFVSLDHGLINFYRQQSKMSSSKKLTCKGTFATGVICLRPPLLLVFCLGWSRNFVGSESGQIQSVTLLQNMVSNRAQPWNKEVIWNGHGYRQSH